MYGRCVWTQARVVGPRWKARNQLGTKAIIQHRQRSSQREVRFWILRFGAWELPPADKGRLKAWSWENQSSAIYSTWNTAALRWLEKKSKTILEMELWKQDSGPASIWLVRALSGLSWVCAEPHNQTQSSRPPVTCTILWKPTYS